MWSLIALETTTKVSNIFVQQQLDVHFGIQDRFARLTFEGE